MDDLRYATELIAVGAALFYALAIASAIEATLNVRTAQGAIAWTISLLAVPYLAVPAYLIFGRNKFDGYLEQRRAIEHESRALFEKTRAEVEKHLIPSAPAGPLYAVLYRLTGIPPAGGNRVQLLIDGKDTFDSMLQGIAA